MNTIRFTVVRGKGLVKIETDTISPANHATADEALRRFKELTGGEQTWEQRESPYSHQHVHEGAEHVHE